jgi:ribosome modulation factor
MGANMPRVYLPEKHTTSGCEPSAREICSACKKTVKKHWHSGYKKALEDCIAIARGFGTIETFIDYLNRQKDQE